MCITGHSAMENAVHSPWNSKKNFPTACKRRFPQPNKIFPNLLKQNFTADAKNKIWCTDFTYIRLSNGKMRYNCTIIDLYDRSAVASLDSGSINTELAIDTLKRAINNENPGSGLILHSDQGCQFTSCGFADFCKSQGIIQSMSKAGCPYDNAPMERFYKTLKYELVYRYHFMNAKALDDAVAQYVFVLFLQKRGLPFPTNYAAEICSRRFHSHMMWGIIQTLRIEKQDRRSYFCKNARFIVR